MTWELTENMLRIWINCVNQEGKLTSIIYFAICNACIKVGLHLKSFIKGPVFV